MQKSIFLATVVSFGLLVSAETRTDVLTRFQAIAESRRFIWAWGNPFDLKGRHSGYVEDMVGARPLVWFTDFSFITGTWQPPSYYADNRKALTDIIKDHWKRDRAIPVFSWHLGNPYIPAGWRHEKYGQAAYRFIPGEKGYPDAHANILSEILEGTGSVCGTGTIDAKPHYQPFKNPRAWYSHQVNEIASFLRGLVDDHGQRIPVVIRHLHECEGSWFFWGAKYCSARDYVRFAHKFAADFRGQVDDDLVFLFSPDRYWRDLGAEGDGEKNYLSRYPGDAYVDLVGYDDYSIGSGRSDGECEKNDRETLRRLRLLSAYAEKKGKIAVLSETGCRSARSDFYTTLLRLATAQDVKIAFVCTWGGPWTVPQSDAGFSDWADFRSDVRVLFAEDRVPVRPIVPMERDCLRSADLSWIRVKGHVGQIQDAFFASRVFSDFAKTSVWAEARSAFEHPDDDVFCKPVGMWKGEFWGKLMISACRVAEYVNDAELKAFLHDEALRIVALQRPDGYLGTYVDPENVSPGPIANARKAVGWDCDWNWNLWCRKYTLWGLLSCYRLTGDVRLLTAAQKAMDQQMDMLNRLGIKLCETGTTSMRGLPPCSILKPLLILYEQTGAKKYLDYATEIVGYCSDPTTRFPQFAEKLKEGRPLYEWYPDELGKWAKAYEMMSWADGVLEYWRITGRGDLLSLVEKLHEEIRRNEYNLCGSVGYNDQFVGAARHMNGVTEPCDAIHWMRLNLDLFQITGRTVYADCFETAFYNAFLAAVSPDRKWGARCVRNHGRHLPAPPQSGMKLQHCCVNNMPRGFMDAAQMVLSRHRDGALHLALYHDSELSIDGDRVVISGDYPVGDKVEVAIDKKQAGVLRLRVPPCCDSLTVGGKDGEIARSCGTGWLEVLLPKGSTRLQLLFEMPIKAILPRQSEVGPVPSGDYRRERWCDTKNDGDLVSVYREKPFAQLRRGPLILARSRRLGEQVELPPQISIGDGWSVCSEKKVGDESVWGRWTIGLGVNGISRFFSVCDFSSASEWMKNELEFSTEF